MEKMKTLNRVCWALGMITGVVIVVLALVVVWAEDWEVIEHLEKPLLTALILFVAAAATIILNNAIMRFTSRKDAKADAPVPAQPPDSNA